MTKRLLASPKARPEPERRAVNHSRYGSGIDFLSGFAVVAVEEEARGTQYLLMVGERKKERLDW